MMARAMNVLTITLLAAAFAALHPPTPAEAQVKEVRQTIFGMDCAPCAYAVERRMQNMEGAADVQLSLNEGFAAVRFEGAHRTTLEQIRKTVRDSGFGPREARILVAGEVVLEEEVRVIRTPSGERFLLVADTPGLLPEAGAGVEVRGAVESEADEAGRWVLKVEGEG